MGPSTTVTVVPTLIFSCGNSLNYNSSIYWSRTTIGWFINLLFIGGMPACRLYLVPHGSSIILSVLFKSCASHHPSFHSTTIQPSNSILSFFGWQYLLPRTKIMFWGRPQKPPKKNTRSNFSVCRFCTEVDFVPISTQSQDSEFFSELKNSES